MLFYQIHKVPLTDDARFYMTASKSYANYLEQGWRGFKYPKKTFIDRYWRENHEHPPFAKLLMASTYLLNKKIKFTDDTSALRLGIILFAPIVLFFIFLFSWQAFSFRTAIFSSLFFIFLPRTFYHAHVATLDFAVGGISFIFVYFYWKSLTSKKWGWATGFVFGLTLATKLNAPFMVVPVLIHYAFIKRKEIKENPLKVIFPPQFLSMLIFSMPVFFAMWPWMWHDTIARFKEYALFHIHHYGILMYYLGKIYSTPRPSWLAPLVMTIVTTPLITLFASILPFFVYKKENENRNNYAMLLTILSGYISLSVLMFLPAPFYSGVKLFQPLFPFLAIMSGAGLYYTVKNINLGIIFNKIKYAVALLFFIPIIIGFIDVFPNHLSYYSELIGGTKGALKYGFERHYYDLFYYNYIDFFNKHLKTRKTVYFEPNGKEYGPEADILKDAGLLTKNFIYLDSKNADFIVLTHEYRWKSYPDLLRKLKNKQALYTFKIQGVPIFTIFKNKN
jgi:4-amino-4-deoxy-L-arabinose transferase-like glycosyltransferase